MAQFHVNVVAHASDATSNALPAPKCFKCKKGAVEAVRAHDDAIVWVCPTCRTDGRISNWQGSLWDLRDARRLQLDPESERDGPVIEVVSALR